MSFDFTQNHNWTQPDLKKLMRTWPCRLRSGRSLCGGRHLEVEFWNFPFSSHLICVRIDITINNVPVCNICQEYFSNKEMEYFIESMK